MAEQIDFLFGVETPGNPRSTICGVPIRNGEGEVQYGFAKFFWPFLERC